MRLSECPLLKRNIVFCPGDGITYPMVPLPIATATRRTQSCGAVIHGVRWSRASMVVNSSHHINQLRARHHTATQALCVSCFLSPLWTGCARSLAAVIG